MNNKRTKRVVPADGAAIGGEEAVVAPDLLQLGGQVPHRCRPHRIKMHERIVKKNEKSIKNMKGERTSLGRLHFS